jgi:hypothetical protein
MCSVVALLYSPVHTTQTSIRYTYSLLTGSVLLLFTQLSLHTMQALRSTLLPFAQPLLYIFYKHILEQQTQMLLVDVHKSTMSSWGPDLHWCGAAESYVHNQAKLAYTVQRLQHELNHYTYLKNATELVIATARKAHKQFRIDWNTSRPGCAVVPATPLRHLNFKTISKNQTRKSEWIVQSEKAATAYRKTYVSRWKFTERHAAMLMGTPPVTIADLKQKCAAL